MNEDIQLLPLNVSKNINWIILVLIQRQRR